jgi:hypothetical protein
VKVHVAVYYVVYTVCTLINVKHTYTISDGVVKTEHDTYCYCISESSTENSLALLNNGIQITSTEIQPGKKGTISLHKCSLKTKTIRSCIGVIFFKAVYTVLFYL